MTYCDNESCPLRKDCERFLGNYKVVDNVWVTTFTYHFSPMNQIDCTTFRPMKDENN